MDWNLEALMAMRALLAAILGALIGWDRERQGREAGIRTYGAVSLGACVFGLISSHAAGGSDPTRIAAGMVTGVGFIGAGVILHNRGRIVGLTTAATLWSAASVGLAMAYGMYTLGALAALIIFSLLSVNRLPWWPKVKNNTETKGGEQEAE